MFDSGFRRRLRIFIVKASSDETLDRYDVPHFHMLVGDVLDEALAKGTTPPAEISDQMAEVLLAAMSRRHSASVLDPFGIYTELVELPQDVLQDLYNHFLAEDESGITPCAARFL